MKLLIKNGTIVNAKETSTDDVLCDSGKIVAIGKNLQTENSVKIIDAKDYYLLPGGIDPHVHMHLPTPAGFSSDNFLTGSKAALFGGTTTIIDFVTPNKGQSLIEALYQRKKEAEKSLIDYSFHVSPIEWTDNTEQEIKKCIQEEGVTSFKIYMAYKSSIGLENEDILKVMKAVAKYGGLVTMHCELGDEIEKLKRNFGNDGKFDVEFHPKSRPTKMEAKAVKRAIKMAKEADCQLYIVHVSSKKSLKHIKKAMKSGQKVYAESCPHYLLLDDRKYLGEFHKTAPYVLSPPLRKLKDNVALWEAIIEKTIQTIGTDHCPFMMQHKKAGLNDFRKIPNGAGGVEHRLALLYTFGVLTNKISLNQFVNISSTKAAKIFDLYPQKGRIAVGADADLLIWDSKVENKISAKTHQQNCDSNIYEDIKTKGSPKYVIIKGHVAIQNGKLVSDKCRGDFIRR